MLSVTTTVAIFGCLGGIALGFTARRLRFCTLSAIENAAFGGDFTQMRMWGLAIAVSIIGAQGLHMAGVIDLGRSFHVVPEINWLGAVAGGLIFGFGMAAIGTCSFGSLLRLGGGDLRAFFDVLVIGVVGYMTMRGITGIFREEVIEATALVLPDGRNQELPSLLAAATGFAEDNLRWLLSLLLAAAILVWCFKDPLFRARPAAAFGGVVVGLVVVSGWWVTGVVGADPFDPQPLGSYTYIRPVGDGLVYLMTFSGSTITFGIGTVVGTLVGAALASLSTGEAHWEGFDDLREMRRHLFGAAAIGFGGVTAMGCTVGQGITGIGTLAATSFLALISIWIGGVVGVRILVYGGAAPLFLRRS